MSIISLDLETTGLDPRRHEAWEIAIVDEEGIFNLWEFPVENLVEAESAALTIGGYYQRHGESMKGHATHRRTGDSLDKTSYISGRGACLEIARLTDNATLMGCAVAFDMRFLEALLHKHDVRPCWHHRGLDLGSYAAGAFGAWEPLSSKGMTAYVSNDEAHTALGDARWNWKMYKSVRDAVAYARGEATRAEVGPDVPS